MLIGVVFIIDGLGDNGVISYRIPFWLEIVIVAIVVVLFIILAVVMLKKKPVDKGNGNGTKASKTEEYIDED